MIHSIRARLSLSHALVALVSTLLLGGLVITSLATYYRLREQVYLIDNAHALSNLLGSLIIEESDLNLITAQINTFSFLTQTRVRLIDTDGQVLADSGSPAAQSGVATINLTLENENMLQTFSRQFSEEEEETFVTEIVLNDGTQSIRSTTSIQGGESPQFDEPLTTPFSLFSSGLAPAELAPESRRSIEVEAVPIRTMRGETIAVVELSEGPAYGRPVVLSVLFASLIAGVITFFAAGLLGRWLSGRFSRPLVHLATTAQAMKEGDLTARARLQRTDEIGEVADSFDQMADRVEETVVSLRRFVADAAHELTTPLTALRARLELALEEPENRASVADALGQTDRLSRLTADLLQLSRLDHNRDVERYPVLFNDLLHRWSEPAAAAAEQKEITFDLIMPATPCWVAGRERNLGRAIGNLLDNALKFTPAGGQIVVEMHANQTQLYCEITDSGIGLGETPEKLFDRFVRAPQAREYPGSGLGLSVAQQIIQQHGGLIKPAPSAAGAKFIVSLPRIQTP